MKTSAIAMMKVRLVFPVAAILLLSVSGCQSTPNPSNVPSQTSNNPTQVTVRIGGSSSAVGLVQSLSGLYQVKNPAVKLLLSEPGQSENAIAGVKQKNLDVAAITKKLAQEENDGSLVFKEVAQDALLVATHESVKGLTGLTTAQLQAIYSGKATNWKEVGGPDAPIVVLDRPEDESAKKLLRKYYLGKDLKNATTTIILRKEGELIQSLQSTPYSIGAFSLASAISNKLPVNRLNLDTIAPAVETIKDGRYKMVRTIGLVWHRDATDGTKSLIDYVESAEGRQQMEILGYVGTPSTGNSK